MKMKLSKRDLKTLEKMEGCLESMAKSLGCLCEREEFDGIVEEIDRLGWFPALCPVCGKKLEAK